MRKTIERLLDWRPELSAALLGWVLLFGWLLLLALAIPATAQTAAPSHQMRQACSADVRSLCSGIMPGGGRIKNCMMEKRSQLSQGCRDALASASTQSKDQGKQ